jgi:hypothetical protein
MLQLFTNQVSGVFVIFADVLHYFGVGEKLKLHRERPRLGVAVDSEIREGVDVFAEGKSHGEGGFGLGVIGGNAGFVFGDAEREKVGLEGGDEIEAPGGVGERLDELRFERAGGLEVIEEAVGVALVNGTVLGGQDDGVAGEAVAEGV